MTDRTQYDDEGFPTTFSDGSSRTLATVRKIAAIFGPAAVAFIDEKIAEDPDGDKGQVIADETQMLMMLASFLPTNKA